MKKVAESIRNIQLQERRKQFGWSQAELAELLGAQEITVRRWEQGVTFPSPYFREKLCRIFDATPEALGLEPEAKNALEKMEGPGEEYVPSLGDQACDYQQGQGEIEGEYAATGRSYHHQTASATNDLPVAPFAGAQFFPHPPGIKSQRRVVIFLGVALLFLVGMLFVPHVHIFFDDSSSNPVLSSNCYSISCDGQQPEQNGCLTDKTLLSAQPIYNQQSVVAMVKFYGSRTCAAAWVSVETPVGTTGNLSAEINTGTYKQYCIPSCPIQRNYRSGKQSVHTAMLHTNQNYHLWGRGCYFLSSGDRLCFPQEDTPEQEFHGFWP